jgi:hypothetical protein
MCPAGLMVWGSMRLSQRMAVPSSAKEGAGRQYAGALRAEGPGGPGTVLATSTQLAPNHNTMPYVSLSTFAEERSQPSDVRIC